MNNWQFRVSWTGRLVLQRLAGNVWSYWRDATVSDLRDYFAAHYGLAETKKSHSQIAEAAQRHGLKLVRTESGFDLQKLGRIDPQTSSVTEDRINRSAGLPNVPQPKRDGE